MKSLICPKCGNEITLISHDDLDNQDLYKCPSCGTEIEEDPVTFSITDKYANTICVYSQEYAAKVGRWNGCVLYLYVNEEQTELNLTFDPLVSKSQNNKYPAESMEDSARALFEKYIPLLYPLITTDERGKRDASGLKFLAELYETGSVDFIHS